MGNGAGNPNMHELGGNGAAPAPAEMAPPDPGMARVMVQRTVDDDGLETFVIATPHSNPAIQLVMPREGAQLLVGALRQALGIGGLVVPGEGL